MKRILSAILCMVLCISLTACGGEFSQVNLQEPIQIPENGIIEKSLLDQIKEENAIATFTGVSDEFDYEWTIFGSDLEETRDVNLAIDLNTTKKGIKIAFKETEDFGFPALLSIHLNEKWKADSATAYEANDPVYSVSLTGSKTSILNLSINKMVSECYVTPDKMMTSEDEKQVVSNNTDGTEENKTETNNQDDYTSSSNNEDSGRVYSYGNATEQGAYQTDPIPEGKPEPVEPEDQEIDEDTTYTCTFSIECSTILNNLEDLDPDKHELVPSNGVILPPTTVVFYQGESVFDVLQRVCRENNIHMESSWTPIYNSAYIEGINNLYEFDCGELSGWMYRVNGWYPNYGCSRYQLIQGENVEFRYTCDLGKDVGCDWMD